MTTFLGKATCHNNGLSYPGQRLMGMVGQFIEVQPADHVAVNSVFPGPTATVPPQLDALTTIWNQVSGLAAQQWVEEAIPRPYIAFDDTLVEAMQHTLPPISVPPHAAGSAGSETREADKYPLPRVAFRLFGDNVEKLPPASSIDR